MQFAPHSKIHPHFESLPLWTGYVFTPNKANAIKSNCYTLDVLPLVKPGILFTNYKDKIYMH